MSDKDKPSQHDEDNLDACPRFTPPLYLQRYEYVQNVLFKQNPPVLRVADFGCAEGRFIRYLKKLPFAEEISVVDIQAEAMEECEYKARPLSWDYVFGRFVALDVNVYQGSVTEFDERFKNLDAITAIELIEHLHPEVLEQFPKNVFGNMAPKLVVVTTPNRDYNELFPQLRDSGGFRHWDHKFEWTREEFHAWCESVVAKYPNYEFELDGVGEPTEGNAHVGHCSQIAIFRKTGEARASLVAPSEMYKLHHSFNYPKRDKANEEEQFEQIDWDLILERDTTNPSIAT